MLFLIGISIVLLVIIVCISNSLSERKTEFGQSEKMRRISCPNSSKQQFYKGTKWEMGEKDLQVLATILSAGLVDADPTTLQHLKEYRDLRGGSN
ncbi:hypothetical protein GJAV_G00018170 [Gymnothorax javanicus]|nr:hypothetical protein GJAV_G00018170 [Gymnothorax javanicus]